MDRSAHDLQNDFTEIKILARDLIERVRHHLVFIAKHKDLYRKGPYDQTHTSLTAIVHQASKIEHMALDELHQNISTKKELTRAVELKKECYDTLRVLYTQAGATIASDRWQAPSAHHSHISQAGAETGLIQATLNDYKRGIQRDETEYVSRFLREHVDQGLRFEPTAHLTSSGMAAFVLAIDLVRVRVPDIKCVLVGKNTYFECLWTLQQWFGNKIVYFDEFDSGATAQQIQDLSPDLIVISSLANSVSMTIPDMKKFWGVCKESMRPGTYVIIDNTSMATMYQPLSHILPFTMPCSLIVVESLLKYHQFGFDRTNMGIVWTYDRLAQPLLSVFHRNTGAMPSDASILSLPRPRRRVFDARMVRIGRNNRIVAQRLDAFVRDHSTPVESIVHPSLPQYPGYQWTKDLQFQGGSFVITFKEKYKNDHFYFSFIRAVVKEAKRRSIDLNNGTSFGFTTARIYFTARFSVSESEPFIRLSMGTETFSEIEDIATLLIDVIKEL